MSSLALYRTYRPGSFADVIGQEHVTVPLSRAIDGGRFHHAYLFTGPRGCGKTSSARILARSLNCEQGPTSTPCGSCDSCIALAPNGPGSFDVIELDAASNGGVDEARELRERSSFAPASSRYKIYILDEAHQLTNAAANALLKIIEEPPPHLRFVFATTEADKILPTIRSRTHHYPFRLVSTRRLSEHLAWVCEQEGIPAEPAALAMVARAGAGSVRDSLSVLGQVIGGAGPEGVTYADAVTLLGVTDAALLDRVVDSLVANDPATLFHVVDQVVDAGHEPRRFALDLLERLRDLVVLCHVPDAISSGLVHAPDVTLEAMTRQANTFGPAALSRAADLVSEGIAELKGATSPRLQLELLCARLAIVGGDDTAAGLRARVERLERRGPAASVVPALPVAPVAPVAPVSVPAAPVVPVAPVVSAGPPIAPVIDPASAPATSAPAAPIVAADSIAPQGDSAPPEPVRTAPAPVAAAQPAPGNDGLASITSMWSTVLEVLKGGSRVAWTAFAHARPLSLADGVLAVGMSAQGTITFARDGGHDERLRQAIIDVVGIDVRPDLVLDPGAAAPSGGTAGSRPAAATSVPPVAPGAAAPPDSVAVQPEAPVAPVVEVEVDVDAVAEPDPAPVVDRAAQVRAKVAEIAEPDEPSADDQTLDDGGLTGLPLVERLLGGTVIAEYDA